MSRTRTRPYVAYADRFDVSNSAVATSDTFGVQMLERAGFDPTRLNERFDFESLESDDSAETIRRQLSLVDEAVQSPRSDPEIIRSRSGTHPIDILTDHPTTIDHLSSHLDAF